MGAYLTLIESAFEDPPRKEAAAVDAKARELEDLGFRVIRVPRLGVVRRIDREWPGISYVNGLTVGRRFFIPEFGLGSLEEEIVSGLQRKLGDSYEVIPVPARKVLLRNGGIHCLAAIVRSTVDDPHQLRSEESRQ